MSWEPEKKLLCCCFKWAAAAVVWSEAGFVDRSLSILTVRMDVAISGRLFAGHRTV